MENYDLLFRLCNIPKQALPAKKLRTFHSCQTDLNNTSNIIQIKIYGEIMLEDRIFNENTATYNDIS